MIGITVSRGLRVTGKTDFVKTGLTSANGVPVTPFIGEMPVKGRFYRADRNPLEGRKHAESFAMQDAKGPEGSTPAVIQATITRQNEAILQGRVFVHELTNDGRLVYYPFDLYRDIGRQQLPEDLVVDFEGLRPDQLAQLNIEVGFKNRFRPGFTYESYADLARKYGIPLLSSEGVVRSDATQDVGGKSRLMEQHTGDPERGW